MPLEESIGGGRIPSNETSETSEFVYKHPEVAVEDLELYRPGGYHPIHIGDIFNSRYQILQKLGHGSFSTVWLTHDNLVHDLVALKVLRADAPVPSEADVLNEIAKSRLEHGGHEYLLEPLDNFIHTGPNGEHQCIVFGVMQGPVCGVKLDGDVLRRFCQSVLKGFDLIHKEGWVHCDFHLERWEGADEFLNGLKRTQEASGTPSLMSPRQVKIIDQVRNLRFFMIEDEESPSLVDFLAKILRWNPEERPSAEELLKHEWLAS